MKKKFPLRFFLLLFFGFSSSASALIKYPYVNKENLPKIIPKIVIEGGSGTGFFITRTLAVTNFHITRYAKVENRVKYASVSINSKIYPGRVLIEDPVNDLAIIKINKPVGIPLKLGDYRKVNVGDEVLVYGYPISGPQFVRMSAREKTAHSLQLIGGENQAEAPAVNSGHSGAPVFSKDFKVIAAVYSFSTQNAFTSYAMPINKLKYLMGRLYGLGLGRRVKQEREALYWYEKWAEDSGGEEKFKLAQMLRYGRGGLPKLKDRAARWYDEAFKAGGLSLKNMYELGLFYEQGEKAPKNFERAAALYEEILSRPKAPDLQKKAAFRLAQRLEKEAEGFSAPHSTLSSLNKALLYYQRAAGLGHKEAEARLKLIRGKIKKPSEPQL